MKAILSSWVSIIVEIVTIILSYSWLQRTNEEEPKIVLVTAFGTLIASLFLRTSAKPKIVFYLERLGVQSSPTRPSRVTSRTSQVGEMSGVKDITRLYKLSLVNNSNNSVFNPQIYINKDFQNIVFTGTFSSSNPIQPTNKVEIQFTFIKTIEGDSTDFEREMRILFPKEFDISFRLLCSYEDENGKKHYTTMKIENNEPINRIHAKMDTGLIKIKVYEPPY